MRWLTDAPDKTGAFLPAGLAWQPLPATLREQLIFWPALAGARPAWHAEVEGFDLPGVPERCGVIIDEAEQSQFTALVEWLKTGASLPDGLVCLALTGHRFHGQRQRTWSALPGNLHLTVHYSADHLASQLQAALAMAPAVAVTQALHALSDGRLQPAIKWTNDILLHDRKVAGVLTSTLLEGRQMQHVVFGVGLNIDAVPQLEPSARSPRPGALCAFEPGLRGRLPCVVREVVRALDAAMALVRTGHAGELFTAYRRRAAFIGRVVSLWPEAMPDDAPGTPLARGRVLELLPDLSLRIEGYPEPFTAGRMVLEESRDRGAPTSGKA